MSRDSHFTCNGLSWASGGRWCRGDILPVTPFHEVMEGFRGRSATVLRGRDFSCSPREFTGPRPALPRKLTSCRQARQRCVHHYPDQSDIQGLPWADPDL